jgi:tetratricopeptide (TPR) repeat protein
MEHNNPSPEFTFTGTLARNSDEWTALLVTGHNLFHQGRLKEASNIFEGLVVVDSHNPYIQGILGSIYQKQQQFELALIRYNNALALNPDDISALCNRGEILLKLGKFQEAALDLRRAIGLDPDKKDGAANRARLLVSIVKDAITLAKHGGVEALEQAAEAGLK